MSAVFEAADDSYWTHVRDRTAKATAPALLLERWARGAGRRSWYVLNEAEDVTAVRRIVRAGAGLTAYFEIDFLVSPAAEPDRLARVSALVDSLGPNDELLAFARDGQETELDVEYVSDVDELSHWLEGLSNSEVWFCPYPDWPEDGPSALTAVVPDDDGLVRNHPY